VCEGTTNCFDTTRLTSSHLDIKEFINTQYQGTKRCIIISP
jgi:hypothetical protein